MTKPIERTYKNGVPRPKNYAKIFDDIKEAKLEWGFSEYIAKIDPYQDYFVYGTQLCEVSMEQLKKQKKNKDCDITNVSNAKYFPQIVIPYGGMALDDYLVKNGNALSLKQLLVMLRPTLVGIQKLDGKIIHQDIKPNNILVLDNRARIIDFGLAVKNTGIWSADNENMMKYWLLPPEYRLFSRYIYKGEGNMKKEQIHAFISHELDLLHLHFHGNWYYRDLLMKYWGNQASYEKELREFIDVVDNSSQRKRTLGKWIANIDTYSLGLILMYTSQFCKSAPGAPPPWENIGFKELICGMTNPNPSHRWALGKCLMRIDDLLLRL